MPRARLVVAVALALAATACSDDRDDVVAATAANLSEIKSGDLLVEASVGSTEGAAGWTLRGDFSLDVEDGALPIADVEFVQFAGEVDDEYRLVSTGDAAYVGIGEMTYELPPEQADSLRVGGGSGGLEELEIGDWLVRPVVEDGPEIDGVPTDVVRADLDVVAAITDLFTFGRSLGADLPELDERAREQLDNAVQEASIEFSTGRDDRLLRDLELRVDLGGDPPAALRDALGSLGDLTFSLTVSIRDVNEPVTVEAPAGALPSTELQL